MKRLLIVAALLLAAAARARAEDGYELWLRYRLVSDAARLAEYRAAIAGLAMPDSTPTLRAARDELTRGLRGLLGRELSGAAGGAGVAGGLVTATINRVPNAALGDEGYAITRATSGGRPAIRIAANTDRGVLYGAFALLRHLQTNRPLGGLALTSAPKITLRLLNHWDNLDRSVERGYAGRSLWAWDSLPNVLSPRYTDYARADASIGVNGAVITNVNANARILTPEYLAKVAALANVFRPYGVRVYLTARFSAPIEIGGLKTADPLDPAVRQWWSAKIDEIYRVIPDFGGFTVKANSEGQPGPREYKRTHADGANMLAGPLARHGGVVMWRAFVYSNDVPTDRVKQAYDEFKPLDGAFAENAFVQVKNGPLDFQPREPFSPLFGAAPKTPLMLELQITKEYLGQDTHLVYLGREWEEVLKADTYARGKGSTVAKVIDGSLEGHARSGIAGVANVGDDRDWTGSQFNQANWYAYGRLAWDPEGSAAAIADEWIRMTFTNDAAFVRPVRAMMLQSREAVVNYMTPLGLAHIMATGHHYGPGPWVSDAGRADWSPTYYHRADSLGVGFDRTASGSDALEQYAAPIRARWGSRQSAPDSVLLWFHHVGWAEKLPATGGRPLWEELARRYNAGVDSVRSMQRTWDRVSGKIDAERAQDVKAFLAIQEKEARWWRDAALSYFQTFSHRPIPTQYEQPAHPLQYYLTVRCPANRDKPRCDLVP